MWGETQNDFFALAGGLAPLKPFSKEIVLQGPLTPFSSQPSTPGKVTISTDSDYPHPWCQHIPAKNKKENVIRSK
jgi:hypothetical protein